MRLRAQQVAQDHRAKYTVLTADQREQLALIAGKDGNGHPLGSHQHAYFAVWPDENGQASRLICFRDSPFTLDEVAAILASSEQPFTWEFGSNEWQVRLVPPPFDTPLTSDGPNRRANFLSRMTLLWSRRKRGW